MTITSDEMSPEWPEPQIAVLLETAPVCAEDVAKNYEDYMRQHSESDDPFNWCPG